MVYAIDKVYYQALLKDKNRFSTYSGIFLPELFYYLNRDDYDYWFFFEKGKSILIFNKEKEDFVEKTIILIKMETRFLKRNIVPINPNPSTLAFVKSCKMDYLQDSHFSENIWLHRSNSNFIQKYLTPKLTKDQITQKFWLEQLKHRVDLKQVIAPYRFYMFNIEDKVIYPQDVAADIINSFGIDFCLGGNNNLLIPRHKIEQVTIRLHCQVKLVPANKNPFYYYFFNKPQFQKKEGITLEDDYETPISNRRWSDE